jgi:hypothetical protein
VTRLHRISCTGRPLSAATVARIEAQEQLLSMHNLVSDMVVQLVTAEWPHGLVKTLPTHKGTIKLLMQPKARD